MIFKETIYIGTSKREHLLDFTDKHSAYKHADSFFMQNSDAGSMHSDWTGPLVRITFISARKAGGKISYILEPAESTPEETT